MKTIHEPDPTLKKMLPGQRLQPESTYIPSQFAFPFAHEGRHYVYNTLTKHCLEAELPAMAAAGKEADVDALIRDYFLVPEGKDECALYESVSAVMRTCSSRKNIREYTILPTFACNARCIYCYQEGMKPVTMTPEVIRQTIAFISENHGGQKIQISWFGGEPLLRPDIIDRICAGLLESSIDYQSRMITNASLLTHKILEKMTGSWRLTHLQLSMDGAERDYIRRKQYSVYHDEYHKVMKNICMLTDAGIDVTVRCNVDEDNWAGIPEFLHDLETTVLKKEHVKLYFCPLNSVRSSKQCGDMWAKIMSVRPKIIQAGFRNAEFYGTEPGFRVFHCMADSNGVVIAPDGSLYPCEHCPPQARYGNIFQGITDERAHRAFTSVGKTREKCRKCTFLPECTSFSSCPIQDVHCKDIRRMSQEEMLKNLLNQEENCSHEA